MRQFVAPAVCLALLLGCEQPVGADAERPSPRGWAVLQELADEVFLDANNVRWKILVERDAEGGCRVALAGEPTLTGVGAVARTWVEQPVPVRVDGDIADLCRIARATPAVILKGDLSARYRGWVESWEGR